MNGVLGEKPKSSGDLTDACVYDELVVACLSVVDEVVDDGNGLGPVPLDEREGLRVAVLDADLDRRWRCLRVGVQTGSDVP